MAAALPGGLVGAYQFSQPAQSKGNAFQTGSQASVLFKGKVITAASKSAGASNAEKTVAAASVALGKPATPRKELVDDIKELTL